MARNRPAPSAVTDAGRQVFPPSKDTLTLAPVIGAAFASWRCPAVTVSTWRPGRTAPLSSSPARRYRSVIIGSTAQCSGSGAVGELRL